MTKLSHCILLLVSAGITSLQQAASQTSLGDAIINTHILTVFTYHGSQIYIYGALSNENENVLSPQ
jgi:hypothetical protein